MIRPLYLAAGARAVEQDGPALRIGAEGRADARVPIRLLSRVVTRTDVQWSAGALGACMRAGVPLVFLDSDGRPTGFCLPAFPRDDDLARRLDILEREPDGPAAFENWAAAEERREILAVAGLPSGDASFDLRPESVRRAVCAWTNLAPEQADAMWRRLEGGLAAQVTGLLLAALLPPQRAAPAPAGRIDLHAACVAAGRWELVPALRQAAEHRLAHPRSWKTAAMRARRLTRRYEAASPRIASKMRQRLRRLESWLWERGP